MNSRLAINLRKLHFPAWTFPLVLLVLCLASFGILVNQLGFYWDDWSKTLVHRIFGLSGYWQYYAEDRPLSSWTHIVFITLLGDRALNWQLFVLALRWLSAVALWWTLRGLWPRQRLLAALAAGLFVVYPVFTQQAIAVTFHQQWLQYLFEFISLGAMVSAYRSRRAFWPLTALSLLTLLLQLSITEYFIGVELVRPLVLWFLVSESQGPLRKRLVQVARWAWPYLLVAAGFIVWRLFFIQLPGADPYKADTLYQFLAQPLAALQNLSLTVWRDSLQMVISHWYLTLDPKVFDAAMPALERGSWLLALAVLVGVSIYYARLDESESDQIPEQITAARQAVLLGLLALLLGAVPAWITGRQVIFDLHSDRYAMPAMFGASLLTVGALSWLAQRRTPKAVALGVLLALAVGYNLRVSNDFRWLWTLQTRFYWQLYWRAPGLQPGTALLGDQEPFPYQGLFSTSAAVNLVYPHPQDSEKMAYWIFALGRRYKPDTLPNPLQMTLHSQFRSLVYDGATPASVVFYYDLSKANCLWIVSPADKGDPGLTPLLQDVLPLSNLERIGITPAAPGYPPVDLFGHEPPQTWCYYFQKAELARQENDWSKVVELGDAARAKGYSPAASGSNSAHEWLVFMDGYARSGRWEDAQSLALSAAETDKRYNEYLCSRWKGYASLDAPASALAAVTQQLECKFFK